MRFNRGTRDYTHQSVVRGGGTETDSGKQLSWVAQHAGSR
jgi:hypothetical protein